MTTLSPTWTASTTYAATPGNPFTLGVASGGMPARPVRVEYEVAYDENFRHPVRRGSVVATPELGHSVHPEVRGLLPDHVYYYRFRTGREVSPTGRTRTAPLPHSTPRDLKFAFASCNAMDCQTGPTRPGRRPRVGPRRSRMTPGH
ncbi:PhoD-like phosphatase N-terminal domain-containing protein [Kribbella sp. NPDC004536]|uniref:PhoD-like phosphatase N-terminal domain-containing protein n=1 Tax=Kribbella sp. NPDC004536 TaxID=3364106 RepID=UPI0036BD4A56